MQKDRERQRERKTRRILHHHARAREREKIDLVRKKNHRPHGKNKSHPYIPRSLWCICSNIFVNVECTEDELGAIFFKKVLFKASFQMHTGDR